MVGAMIRGNTAATAQTADLDSGDDGHHSGTATEIRSRAGGLLAENLAGQLIPGLRRLDPMDGRLNGFGGLHGGIIAAACIEASRPVEAEDSWSPVSVNVDFIRAITAPVAVHSTNFHRGRRSRLSAVSIDAAGTDEVSTTATVRWGNRGGAAPIVEPPAPTDIAPIESCEEFVVPREFVPIAPLFRIFPAAGPLPYSGSSDPRLCAWVELTRGQSRTGSLAAAEIAVLADSLAPSVAATFSELLTVPTVTMAINYFSQGENAAADLDASDSGRVLIDARSVLLGGGWVSETIGVWNANLRPLAQAMQIRLIAPRK